MRRWSLLDLGVHEHELPAPPDVPFVLKHFAGALAMPTVSWSRVKVLLRAHSNAVGFLKDPVLRLLSSNKKSEQL
jgi:hypothetical protein